MKQIEKIAHHFKLSKKFGIEILVIIFSIVFSVWLMSSTFSYKNGEMIIASKAWSDFASHVPLIRSFSFGENFPPQYPLFAGPQIKYHFIFYAFVGILERTGIRIDYALNIPSILGFSILLISIYFIAKNIFKSKTVGILSILFFLFNGSLDFVKYFLTHPISSNTISEIISNQQFISFGPYDESIISAFWNLNIFTNQRHLALSYGISLILIYLVLKPYLESKKSNLRTNTIIGIIFGLTFFLNMAVFLMTAIAILVTLMFSKNYRKSILLTLLIGSAIALPQYLYIQQGGSSSQISLHVGYLINSTISVKTFLNYWFQNLGLHLFLAPLGFFIAPKKTKVIFLSFFALFAIGNLFQFSPEIAANHKFFNYFLIVASMFSAYFLFYLWNKKNYFRPLVAILTFLLIFSGVINFFPIFNDSKITLADYPKNKDISWIMKNTDPNSVFLNTQYLYDNASLAGRKIFLGWPYFAWSQGYDTLTRDNLRLAMLKTDDVNFFCKYAIKYNIDYVEASIQSQDAIVNKLFFEGNFSKVYENLQSGVSIYNLSQKCL